MPAMLDHVVAQVLAVQVRLLACRERLAADTDSEALEGRLVRTVLMASETDPGQPRAAHLCTDAGSNAGAARYCFGTPAPTLQYD